MWNRNKNQRGFSLLELATALASISIGLPAIAYMYTAAMTTDSDSNSRTLATFLANSLMNEISERRFKESSTYPGNGPESGEVISASYSRTNFNDIDDYNQFKLAWGKVSPPRDETGTSLTDYSNFSQYVEVINVNPPGTGPTTRDFTAVTDGSTSFKVVTVTISWKGGNVAISKLFVSP